MRRRSAHSSPSVAKLPPHLQADILATPHSKLGHSDCVLKPGIRLVRNERGLSAAPTEVLVRVAPWRRECGEFWAPLLYTGGSAHQFCVRTLEMGEEEVDLDNAVLSLHESPSERAHSVVRVLVVPTRS
eukprot:COSAG04_NODE_1972_length_5105_cov_1.690571_5_plen_129_part_00